MGRTDPDRWREVVVLAGGINALSDPGSVWSLLKALADRKNAAELTESEAWGLRLASEILSESVALDGTNQRQRKILNKIQEAMPVVLITSHLAARERADAGRYLAKIGDPRKILTDVDAMPFFHVPAGLFFMGQGEYDENFSTLLSETPAGEYALEYDFWIAQYLVTVAQFQMFVNESGFDVGDSDALKATPNTPVVNVSQEEVLAFCKWLTQRWRMLSCFLKGGG